MSVIINELDVAVAPAAPPAASAAAPSRKPAANGPTPLELRALARHLAERAERVRAD